MDLADLAEVGDLVLGRGLAGFPAARHFVLVPVGEDQDPSPYALLRSTEVEDLEFVVVPSAVFFPDYAPVVGDDVVDELGLDSADDAVILLVVTVAEPVEASTANLMGPVIVNRHTRRAVQAVLSPDEHSARQPLLAGAG